MFRFKVLGGGLNHKGQDYHKGDIVETNVRLDELFGEQFKLLDSEEDRAFRRDKVKEPPPSKSSPRPSPKTEIVEEEEEEEDFGEDVTDKYPIAKKNDYIVRCNDDGYFVFDLDEPDYPLNPKPLAKTKVTTFIKTNIGSQED